MKKNLLLTLPILALIPACSNGSSSQDSANIVDSAIADTSVVVDDSSIENVDVPAEAVESIAYRVASGGSFLATEANQDTSISALFAPKARVGLSNPAPNDTIASALVDVNPFMKTAEEMMDGEEKFYSNITFDGTTYTMTLEDGTTFSYTETDRGYKGDEYLYTIQGTYTVNGVTYDVTGKREVESSLNESETETTFHFSLNGVRTLTIEGEMEEENEGLVTETENSLTYVYYGDGATTSTLEVELSYEVEGTKTEMSIEVQKGRQEAEYVVNRVDATALTLLYEFEEGNAEYAGTINVAIGTDTYAYSVDGTVIATLPRT